MATEPALAAAPAAAAPAEGTALSAPAVDDKAGADAAKVAADAKAAESKAAADAKTATDAKAAEAAKAEEAKKAEAKAAADKAEAAKPLTLKLPDGIKLEDLGALEPLAKELGLDSPKTQKVVEHFLALDKARSEKESAGINALHAEWKAALKADPTYGGDKFEGSKKAARKLLTKYGDKELTDLLESNPIGDHPALFRLIAKLGHAMAEDTVAGPGTQSPAAKPPVVDPAQARLRAIYPSMFPKES